MAFENVNADQMSQQLMPGSRGYGLVVGATAQPNLPAPGANTDLTATAAPDISQPVADGGMSVLAGAPAAPPPPAPRRGVSPSFAEQIAVNAGKLGIPAGIGGWAKSLVGGVQSALANADIGAIPEGAGPIAGLTKAAANIRAANRQKVQDQATAVKDMDEHQRSVLLNLETQARTVADAKAADRLDDEAKDKREAIQREAAKPLEAHHQKIADNLTEQEIMDKGFGNGKPFDPAAMHAYQTGSRITEKDGAQVRVPTWTIYKPDAEPVKVTAQVSDLLKKYSGLDVPEGSSVDGDTYDSMVTKSLSAFTTAQHIDQANDQFDIDKASRERQLQHPKDLVAVGPAMSKLPGDMDEVSKLQKIAQHVDPQTKQPSPEAQSAQRLLNEYTKEDWEKIDKARDDREARLEAARDREQTKRDKKLIQDGNADQIADSLIHTDMDPSQLSKRSENYYDVLARAKQLSLAETGKPYDIAKAQADYDFYKNIGTQNTLKYLNSLTGDPKTGATGNMADLVNLSNSITRTKFPALNDAAAWARLQSGDPSMSNFNGLATEVADQFAKIMAGGGSGNSTTDAKIKQGMELFNHGFNKEQLQGMANTLRGALMNRKTELIGDNRYLLKQYGAPPAPAAAQPDKTASVTPPPAAKSPVIVGPKGERLTLSPDGKSWVPVAAAPPAPAQ